MTRERAMVEYLSVAKAFPSYCVKLFEMTNQNGKMYWVSSLPNALLIYEYKSNITSQYKILWSEIDGISSNTDLLVAHTMRGKKALQNWVCLGMTNWGKMLTSNKVTSYIKNGHIVVRISKMVTSNLRSNLWGGAGVCVVGAGLLGGQVCGLCVEGREMRDRGCYVIGDK